MLVGFLEEVLLYDSDLVKVLHILIQLGVLDTIVLPLTEPLLMLILIADVDHEAHSVWIDDGLTQFAVHMDSFHHHALPSLSILFDELCKITPHVSALPLVASDHPSLQDCFGLERS